MRKSGDFYPHQPIWLARWYDYRTTDWVNYLEYPEFTLKQTQQLLTLVEEVK